MSQQQEPSCERLVPGNKRDGQMKRAVRMAIVVATLALVGASPVSASVPWIAHQVTVMTGMEPQVDPSVAYELAIGTTTFTVYPGDRDGSATVKTDESQTVTLRAIPSCELITSFTGRSGYLY